MLSPRELILLSCLLIASASSASISLAEKELECYSQEKVYHEDSDACYKLLTKGPCESGEWLVLERPKKNDRKVVVKPVCAKEKCEEGQYYWASTRICVKSDDKRELCGESKDEELLNNVFGEGECSCAREPPRARLHGDKRQRCHRLYTRGPCQRGHVLVLPEGETTNATCVEDPCYKESIVRKKNGTLSKDGVLAAFENGICYELGTQGPCAENLIFKVHASLLKPSCSSLTTTIFSLQKPQNCYQDENGDCQKRVHSVNKRPVCTSLLNNIFSGVKQCPVDENGDCQMQIIKKKGNKYLKELENYLKNK